MEERGSRGGSLVGGGSTLAVAMILANAGNYVLNLYLGRALGPAAFSDANLMVTLMLSTTALSLGLEMVTSRFVARLTAEGHALAAADLVRRLRRAAWVAGGVLAGVLMLGAPVWQRVFQTAEATPFVVLGVGLPAYLAQSVGRGALQGRLRFGALALTFVVEMLVRLVLGVVLVEAGLGVVGATLGLTASFVATWLVVTRLLGPLDQPATAPATGLVPAAELRGYAGLVSVLLLAQIVANNSDVLVAKAALDPERAGVYAAVALVGRAVFFVAWSVATVVFPVSAAAAPGASRVLRGGLLVVAALGAACTLGALLLGDPVLRLLLGEGYGGVAGLLAAYAGATTLFALANLVASVRLSQGDVAASWLVLGGAVLQVGLLALWHADATGLVRAQVVAMAVLVLALSVQAVAAARRPERHDPTHGGTR